MGLYSLHGKPESVISFCGFRLGWSGGEVGNYVSIIIGKLREVKRVIRGHTAGRGNWSSRLQISSSDSAQLCSTPLGRPRNARHFLALCEAWELRTDREGLSLLVWSFAPARCGPTTPPCARGRKRTQLPASPAPPLSPHLLPGLILSASVLLCRRDLISCGKSDMR